MSKRVVIYTTSDEYTLIKEIANLHGIPISTYIRLVGLRRYIGESGSGSGIFKKQMRAIGNSAPEFNRMNSKKEKQITIYLNEQDYKFIQTIAKKQSISISNYLKLVGTARFIGIHKEAKIVAKEMKNALKGFEKSDGDFVNASELKKINLVKE